MSALIIVCAIIAVVFWRAALKIAAILVAILLISGALVLFEGLHHVIK
jgi:hypothetical protein